MEIKRVAFVTRVLCFRETENRSEMKLFNGDDEPYETYAPS